MQQQQEGQGFGIAEARRVLDDVFAPWVKDLDLSVEAFDFEPPAEHATGRRARSCACRSRNDCAAMAAWSAARH